MSRSRWKGPYTTSKHLKNTAEIKKNHQVPTMNRDYAIVPRFVGLTFKIHNGRNYSEITITDEMIGHKFGEFAATRAKFYFKKKKSKK